MSRKARCVIPAGHSVFHFLGVEDPSTRKSRNCLVVGGPARHGQRHYSTVTNPTHRAVHTALECMVRILIEKVFFESDMPRP